MVVDQLLIIGMNGGAFLRAGPPMALGLNNFQGDYGVAVGANHCLRDAQGRARILKNMFGIMRKEERA